MFRFHQRAALAALAAALLIANSHDIAGQTLQTLIQGNERFGRQLLARLHGATPHRNVVLAPISVSIILGALHSASDSAIVRAEIANMFGWSNESNFDTAAYRVLLSAFEKPQPTPVRQTSGMSPYGPTEAAWISNTVVHRGANTLTREFIASGERSFGITFATSGDSRPTPADLRRSRAPVGSLPSTSSQNDLLISSGTHLRTAWRGNTFALSKPFKGEFETSSGSTVVEMLASQVATYRYAKTPEFEAVVLPANHANFLAVLPRRGQNIRELANELAATPEVVDSALRAQAGTVTIPIFDIHAELTLRDHVESMGVREVFKDLGGIVTIPGSRLTEINQSVDFTVDRLGIRASAETVGGAIYGGIGIANQPFEMKLNRPFVFFVRDTTTDALLFLGAVVDPTQQ